MVSPLSLPEIKDQPGLDIENKVVVLAPLDQFVDLPVFFAHRYSSKDSDIISRFIDRVGTQCILSAMVMERE